MSTQPDGAAWKTEERTISPKKAGRQQRSCCGASLMEVARNLLSWVPGRDVHREVFHQRLLSTRCPWGLLRELGAGTPAELREPARR